MLFSTADCSSDSYGVEAVRPFREGIRRGFPEANLSQIVPSQTGASEIDVLQVGTHPHAAGVRIEGFIGLPSMVESGPRSVRWFEVACAPDLARSGERCVGAPM
jgi:hypothetical protein